MRLAVTLCTCACSVCCILAAARPTCSRRRPQVAGKDFAGKDHLESYRPALSNSTSTPNLHTFCSLSLVLFSILSKVSSSDGGEIRCPYSQQGKKNLLPSYNTTEERRMKWEEMPEVKELNLKYTPGKQSEGETFCSSDSDNKYCNIMHGDWGDSIPKDGEYCIFAILEFEDKEGFFDDPADTQMFEAIFWNELVYLADPDRRDTWLLAAGTGGLRRGDLASPWAFSSIVWKNGNEHAKKFISERHRDTAQVVGLGLNFTFHGHYKAVKCDEIWPALEANGLNQTNFEGGAVSGLLPREGGPFDNHLNLWNAFSDMKSYHEDFYPEDTCHVGPCPGDGTPPDAIVEDDEECSKTAVNVKSSAADLSSFGWCVFSLFMTASFMQKMW